jgi:hypothetical protein
MLEEVPVPERMPTEQDFAFAVRWEAAVDRWIEIAFDVNLLDRTCKREASEKPKWRNRNLETFKSDGTVDEVSQYSGFIATINPPTSFGGVPLNSTRFAEWLEFARGLHARISKSPPGFIEGRMKLRRNAVVGPTANEDFKARKAAWDEGLDKLLTDRPLEVEIKRIERLMEDEDDSANPNGRRPK